MADSRVRYSRLGLTLIVISVVVGACGCAQLTRGEKVETVPEESARVLPWEWWRDLARIASVASDDRVLTRSSYCPSGCQFDRHSEGDSRFIRTRPDGEGVIFETGGAGAVTRIWMVMGKGISEPLDASIRLRIRIDGHQRPVIDLSLPKVFDGSTTPFLPPLVADRETSGGGHVSYVPIPFRDGCEISLVGAESAKIWFQVTARMVDDSTGIRSYSGKEDLEELHTMLDRVGKDPWQGAPSPTVSGSAVLTPGGTKLIAALQGPDLITGIMIRANRRNWHRLGLRLTFDGGEPQLIPLLDLMGIMRPNGGTTKSLLMGADDDGDLYCYFPMPFFEGATVELMRRPLEGPTRVKVEYAVRTAGTPPPDDAGIFRVQVLGKIHEVQKNELTLFEEVGGGKWVGLVADTRRLGDLSWEYLEGDERVAIDGEDRLSWNGTGTEDFFNGGFYFRTTKGSPRPFTTAFAGAPFILVEPVAAVMYRLFLGDAVVYDNEIRAGLEIGPTGEFDIQARTVAYYYAARSAEGE